MSVHLRCLYTYQIWFRSGLWEGNELDLFKSAVTQLRTKSCTLSLKQGDRAKSVCLTSRTSFPFSFRLQQDFSTEHTREQTFVCVCAHPLSHTPLLLQDFRRKRCSGASHPRVLVLKFCCYYLSDTNREQLQNPQYSVGKRSEL